MSRAQDHSLNKRPNTETRLAQALAPRLSVLLETCVQWTDLKLYPVRGYWRQTKADVMQWTGVYEVGARTVQIGCWESMTDCLRYGFEVDFEKGRRRYADVMVSAKSPPR